MSPLNYKELCLAVNEVVRETGRYLLEQLGTVRAKDVEAKGHHNYVTYVDKQAEELIVERLSALLPGSVFIAEEDTQSGLEGDLTWIVDPLDGTTNFIHGVPLFCVSIALREKDEIVVGVVYEVNLDECFYAWKGGPALLNGSEIRVSQNVPFTDALLATGFPYYDYGRLNDYIDVFRKFMEETAGLRRLGSAAADLVYTACGRFDGFYEYGLSPWDVAAGALIVQQAGGKVSDFSGGENYIFGKEVVAAAPGIHSHMMEIIGKNFSFKEN